MPRITMLLLVLLAGTAAAVTLPVNCDFDADTPDAPPAIGGDDQPSSFSVPAGGSILVKASDLGLADQPCVIDQGSAHYYGSIDFAFDPLTEDLLIFEATMSVDVYCNSYLMQTAASNGAVAARLRLLDDGSLVDNFLTPLGQYVPGQPFRCRIIVNLEDQNWDFLLDDELNGFGDDALVEDLEYVNDPSVVPDMAKASASLGNSQGLGARAAYDDIHIETQEYTPAAPSSWSSVKAGY